MRIPAVLIALAACFLTAGILAAQDAPCGEGCSYDSDVDLDYCVPGGGSAQYCSPGNGGCWMIGSCGGSITVDGSVTDPSSHRPPLASGNSEDGGTRDSRWSETRLWVLYIRNCDGAVAERRIAATSLSAARAKARVIAL